MINEYGGNWQAYSLLDAGSCVTSAMESTPERIVTFLASLSALHMPSSETTIDNQKHEHVFHPHASKHE